MNNYAFYSLLDNNLWLYIASFFIVIPFFYLFYKRYIISIIDPLFFNALFSFFSGTVVVFLYFTNSINSFYLISYIFTQISFLIGLNVFKPIVINSNKNNKILIINQINGNEYKFLKILYIIVAFIYVFCQLLSYKQFGIPILNETSRLAVYENAGGMGKVLKRFIDTLFIPFVLLNVIFFFQKNKNLLFKFLNFCFLFLNLVFILLTGSKGAFLVLVFLSFNFSFFSIKFGNDFLINNLNKHVFKIIFIAIIFALFVVILTEKTSNPIKFFIYRLIQSGDIFYMSYPNSIIDFVPKNESNLINFFASPLKLLGIIEEKDIPESMGFFLMKLHHPEVAFKGPNPRMNVFGLHFLGFGGSVFYCFLLGFIISFVRNKLFKLLPSSIIGLIFYCVMINFALKLETDFYSSLADLINIIIVLPIVITISYFTYKVFK